MGLTHPEGLGLALRRARVTTSDLRSPAHEAMSHAWQSTVLHEGCVGTRGGTRPRVPPSHGAAHGEPWFGCGSLQTLCSSRVCFSASRICICDTVSPRWSRASTERWWAERG